MTAEKYLALNRAIEEKWMRYHSGEDGALEDVLPYLMELSLRVASRTCGAYIGPQEDEAGVAQLALWEAVRKYNPGRGRFLFYLGQVVRNRIIDYKRQQTRRREYAWGDAAGMDSIAALSEELEDILDELACQQEIQNLNHQLELFAISFSELPRASPRRDKTRRHALEAAGYIANDDELKQYLLDKRMLPLQLLENRFKVNRKELDRYRKYIITAAIILMGDYQHLREYIKPMEGGKEK